MYLQYCCLILILLLILNSSYQFIEIIIQHLSNLRNRSYTSEKSVFYFSYIFPILEYIICVAFQIFLNAAHTTGCVTKINLIDDKFQFQFSAILCLRQRLLLASEKTFLVNSHILKMTAMLKVRSIIEEPRS